MQNETRLHHFNRQDNTDPKQGYKWKLPLCGRITCQHCRQPKLPNCLYSSNTTSWRLMRRANNKNRTTPTGCEHSNGVLVMIVTVMSSNIWHKKLKKIVPSPCAASFQSSFNNHHLLALKTDRHHCLMFGNIPKTEGGQTRLHFMSVL